MAFRFSDFPYLIRNQPEVAVARVMKAVHGAKGNVTAAAEELEMSVRSLWLIIRALDLQDQIDAARDLYRNAKTRRR